MTTAIHTEAHDDYTVVVTAVVPAPPERVHRALTDPSELARWWWPQRFATTYEVDARPGGAFRTATTALPDDQRLAVDARFLEITATRLTLSWRWEGEAEESQVVIDLRALDDRHTEVVVTHGANASTEARDVHGQGWHDCLVRLVEYVPGNSRG